MDTKETLICKKAVQNINSLEEISRKYKTDKLEHGYILVYNSIFEKFRNDQIKLLEIGVRQGWSHLTWREYFKNGKIYGIENYASPVFDIKKQEYNFDNIEVFIGDQEDEIFLESLPIYDLDIIIDDGGHRMSQQQVSLALLLKRLKPGGLYIIEDLHTSNENMKQYWDDNDPKKTTIYVLKNLKNSTYISEQNWQYFLSRIESINFYTNDKLCIIKTKI